MSEERAEAKLDSRGWPPKTLNRKLNRAKEVDPIFFLDAHEK